MKLTLTILLIVLGCTSALLLPPRPMGCDDDLQHLVAPWCSFVPVGCWKPACGSELTTNKQRWFKSPCHMKFHNMMCRSRFQKSIEARCDPLTRPEPSPELCPYSLLA